jgi:hypothetical protein
MGVVLAQHGSQLGLISFYGHVRLAIVVRITTVDTLNIGPKFRQVRTELFFVVIGRAGVHHNDPSFFAP